MLAPSFNAISRSSYRFFSWSFCIMYVRWNIGITVVSLMDIGFVQPGNDHAIDGHVALFNENLACVP